MQTPPLAPAEIIANCQQELSTCVALLQETQNIAIPEFLTPGTPTIDAMEKIQNVDYVQQISNCVIAVLEQLAKQVDGPSIQLDPEGLCPKDVATRLLS